MFAAWVLLFGSLSILDEDAAARLKGFEKNVRRHAGDERLGTMMDEQLPTLAGLDSAELVETLVDVYVALERVAAQVEAERQDDLERGARDRPRIDRVRAAQDRLLARLAEVQSDAGRRRAAELAVEERKAALSLRLSLAARAGPRQADPAMLRQVLRGRGAQDLHVALLIAAQLGEAGGPLAERVVKLLEHDDAAMRVQAARTLAEFAQAVAIEPLIGALELSEGRDQREFAAALERLTRQPLGRSAVAWRRWWADHRERALAGELPLGGGEAKVANSASGYYFGIAQDGKSILYVVDVSNSMKHGLGDDGESKDLRARTELLRAVEALPEDCKFNVVAFGDAMFVFAPRQVVANDRSARDLRTWLDTVSLELGTNTYGALEMGFSLAGRGAHDRWYDSAIDTLFLLSDGKPTLPKERGKVPADDPERILAAVRRWNPLGRVMIHTITLGKGQRGGFMKKLAAQNGGRHVLHTGD